MGLSLVPGGGVPVWWGSGSIRGPICGTGVGCHALRHGAGVVSWPPLVSYLRVIVALNLFCKAAPRLTRALMSWGPWLGLLPWLPLLGCWMEPSTWGSWGHLRSGDLGAGSVQAGSWLVCVL